MNSTFSGCQFWLRCLICLLNKRSLASVQPQSCMKIVKTFYDAYVSNYRLPSVAGNLQETLGLKVSLHHWIFLMKVKNAQTRSRSSHKRTFWLLVEGWDHPGREAHLCYLIGKESGGHLVSPAAKICSNIAVSRVLLSNSGTWTDRRVDPQWHWCWAIKQGRELAATVLIKKTATTFLSEPKRYFKKIIKHSTSFPSYSIL